MSFEHKLKEIKVEYVKNFSHTLSEIEKNLFKKNLSLLQDHFHKLKGSGKTYGLPEVSKVSEILESICKSSPPFEILKKNVDISLELLKDIQSYYSKILLHEKDQENLNKHSINHRPTNEDSTHNCLLKEKTSSELKKFELKKDKRFIVLKAYEMKKNETL